MTDMMERLGELAADAPDEEIALAVRTLTADSYASRTLESFPFQLVGWLGSAADRARESAVTS